VGEVDGLGLLLELGELAAGVVVALLEGDERVGGLALERELLGELGPVELDCCVALKEGVLAYVGDRARIGCDGAGGRARGRWEQGGMTHSDGHCDDGLD
jgi:hypothetical protein